MNKQIADNTVGTLKKYLSEGLKDHYDQRESENIITELFHSFLNWNRTDVMLKSMGKLSESEILKFHFALKRLKSGEPLQYITGKSFFHGLSFDVNPSVLIPRPETEELVDTILKTERRTAPAILDIGTGSGCIAISLKKSKELARVSAIDISADAIKTAKQNATNSDVLIQFMQMDILLDMPKEKYDIIVSNPPYIAMSEKQEMRTQVVNHEPWVALFVEPEDPLIFYRRIIYVAKMLLNPGGSLWFEIHEDKMQELTTLMQNEHIRKFNFMKDMQGKDRMLHISFE